MGRLENIHIEKYLFTIQERPILALIKLYLNTTDESVKAVKQYIWEQHLSKRKDFK
ncbi:MAG: hypothetical protein ACI4F9_06755 [Lachnospiraceae bacterium]